MYGVVPKSMWNKANPADENNMCTWAMRCLLVEHGNYRILIDSGMGTKQDEKFFSYYYPHGEDTVESSLAKHGFKPEDITDVFHTHLHFDHCGGSVALKDGMPVPAFPKALFWTNPKHWALALNPNEREKASFLKENFVPLEEAGVLRFIETQEGDEWLQDFRIRYVNGHTEAMMLPQIKYKDTTILYCADLLPSASHLSLPWVMAYDMRPLDTLKEKRQILTEAAANDWILFFEHDPKVECASIHQTERGVRVKDTFKLSELDDYLEKRRTGGI